MSISRLTLLAALAAGGIPLSLPSAQAAAGAVTGTRITGSIDLLELDDPTDVWSGGRMVVNGQVVIIPRNLILQLPANWLTLQQLFEQAPAEARAAGKSGLAAIDGVGVTGFATVLGNRTGFGNVIAGDVFIEKGREVANGTVTFIDHTQGYLRIDGIVGDDSTGLMVRINDPEGRHTIQSGKGCDGGPNCSPDPRFTNDPDNYTIAFTTGYPAGLPSTLPLGQRPGFRAGDSATARADVNGQGDPLCPVTNRTVVPVPDSTKFAPIRIGDSISAEGNFEEVAGERFLSCHTLTVMAGLVTQNSPTQPDYMTFDEVEWDVPAFQNQRTRLLLIGFTTLNASELDVFALHVDPLTNENHETPLASTVGNPDTVNQGIIAGSGGIFKIRYDVDFVQNNKPDLLPCTNLVNAGLDTCPGVNPTLENFNHMVPITRELQGRTRHILNPGVITRDINGNQATNGQYLTPVGLGFPEFVEIDLAALQTPLSFDGLPWNLDRRLSPVGCDGGCEGAVQPLSPFPVSNINPAFLSPGGRTRMHSFFPFTAASVLAWPPVQPAAFPIVPTPRPVKPGVPVAPLADFTASGSGGTVPTTIAFTNATTGVFGAQLWSFGDGAFSVEPNPVHTYTAAGAFDVTLTALGAGGTSSLTKAGLVTATDPGGSNPPVANFRVDRTAGNVPLPVQFTDLSTGEVSAWSWNFGDGSFSSAQNPLHSYLADGVYTVTLTASGPGGSNVISKLDLITANVPNAAFDVDFVANLTTGPAPLTVRFRAVNVVGRALIGTFDFGDGTTGTVSAGNGRVTHVYGTPGTYTVTLTANDGVNEDIEQKVGFIVVQ